MRWERLLNEVGEDDDGAMVREAFGELDVGDKVGVLWNRIRTRCKTSSSSSSEGN